LKVDEGGPWLFRQSAVCIEKYDGISSPDNIDLNFFSTWIQIHKLPIGYRKNPLITHLVEKKVGKVVGVETNVQGAGNFVRARVKIGIHKPLARFVSMSKAGKRENFQIKYEKMPRFCGACGLIGHSHPECGTGEFEEDKLKWGECLKAEWDTWHGRGFAGNRGGGRFGRGGREGCGDGMAGCGDAAGRGLAGRGNGEWKSWRFNVINRVDDELTDTATSPSKDTGMEPDNREAPDAGAKRRLSMGISNPIFEETEDGSILMITDGNLPLGTVSTVDDGTDRSKRTKKAGADSPSLRKAAFSIGDYKAPGPNGLHAVFYKKFWGTLW
jgi:hypothetical protein